MPIRLKDLQNKTRKIAVDVQGETLNVEYFVNMSTPSLVRAMTGWNDDEAMQRGLCLAIKGWDLIDEEGKEIPLTFEELEKLPMPFLQIVQKAILDDMRGGAEAKNG